MATAGSVQQSLYQALPLITLIVSALTAVIIFGLRDHRRRQRTFWNLFGATIKLALVAVMVYAVVQGVVLTVSWPVLPGVTLRLSADPLALFFALLSAALWLLTTLYAIAYLENSGQRARFFGFFSLCVAATAGIALAGNLFTFFIFYEALTLATYPLVVHRGHPAALAAGRTYLRYTLGGGALLLCGVVGLYAGVGDQAFAPGGMEAVAAWAAESPRAATVVLALLLAGVAVKAALVPLHGWLPIAMVAPAPVSALLHAVAVVKAGAYGVIRIVQDVYGADLALELGVTPVLAAVAAVTILYGSLRALAQRDIKRRLAFSTVSQVSFITLGVAMGGAVGLVGGIVHLVHQGLMKITLFFCAGNYAEKLGIHRIDQLNGVGWRMPWTSVAFTIGALGMIGLPPLAGFISKWHLGLGAYQQGWYWIIGVLVCSTLLNAAYFLPVLRRIWLLPSPPGAPSERLRLRGRRLEAHPWLLWPPLITALAALFAGVLAASPISPLSWAERIVEQEYVLP
ncbi:proton-conducting membrane transporter [Halorhodospira abdelmalekii]|uniref:complex I subunit 5 family protein n=1 Tax=Halorhodospira abdelmalekii TaxID=421629 RepID=UPI0019079FF1|nr:proton-conducting transporter membrane subunit [Halorhodospira abdelmalekii]MBK1735304.1 proton-conducting membrane transporter [Halorhodospira abdelmalekii]